MAEDLRNYKLQLQQVIIIEKAKCKPVTETSSSDTPAQSSKIFNIFVFQVEAALLTDPDNEELLKLKTDLEEVIELTQDLIKTQEGEAKGSNIHGSSNDDDFTASLLAAEEGGKYASDKSYSKWHVGEKCLAKWKTDGM